MWSEKCFTSGVEVNEAVTADHVLENVARIAHENKVQNIAVILVESLTSTDLIQSARYLENIKKQVLYSSLVYMNVK